MRKFISTIAGALMMFALSAPLATVAKSAEFFTIGTGGPTGVYFQTGNAICKMMHKFAISADHGRKKGTNKAYRCTCLLYTSPSPRDATLSRMPSSA